VHTNDFQSDSINVERSAVRSLTAANAQVERSAVQRLTSDALSVSQSAIGIANASTIEIKEGSAGIVAGDYVRIENGRAFVLLAPRVNGNVQAVLTIPAAFAFGAGYFVARRLLTSAFGRKSS
jgi:uncharacterized protein (DUF169 family)